MWPWPPGTIVVCVDAVQRNPFIIRAGKLVEGAYYTVSECLYGCKGDPCVRISEVMVINRVNGIEGQFMASRFRKAESTHNEAEMLRQIKEPVNA